MGSDQTAQPKRKLPVIDFSPENLKRSWASTSDDVRRALEEYGCFVAVYPDVSPEFDKALFGSLLELFELPRETKALNTNVRPLHGYLGAKAPLPDIHESLGIEHAQTLEATQDFTKLMWPNGNDRFCENVCTYAKLASKLDGLVKKMIFESYGAGKYFDKFIESTNYLLRLIQYRVPKGNESNIGAHCHTDKGVVTIIHQNQVNGLEIRTKDGGWIEFDHEDIPSTFVVFAGDALLAWSNGRIHSPQHQVIISGNETRYSVGLFSFHNGTIEIPKELVDDEHPAKFKSFSNYGLLNFFTSDHDISRKAVPCVNDYCGVEA
ncbi:probable 2-oxoglutarate-dependent dioxygenase AOP1 [Malania oleifera]|uniref:probable 2-oxoglutarate-dependent dioxygenase AOP1 n=1 Tax=Malania oleifera TaxID=397392 RepID=UPI0025AE9939|nr:probable 2-oxoglutarate-dependent dioxygenase AOP1 [Malania oleifera]